MGPALLTTSHGKPRNAKGQHKYYRTYWRTHRMPAHLPKHRSGNQVDIEVAAGASPLQILEQHGAHFVVNCYFKNKR